MAAAGTLTVTGTITGAVYGSKTIAPASVETAAAVADQYGIVLASGFNAIFVPATASAVFVVFDATSTVTKTLKGVTGDTGILLAKTNLGVVLHFDTTPPASFGITTSGADTGKTTDVFFI
jgi:hypothetical protein